MGVGNKYLDAEKIRTARTDSAFGSNFITCQTVTCAIFLFACKICFTKVKMYLTMKSELCLNCLLCSGVGGGIGLLVSVDLWPKISLCEDGMKELKW